jgi:putative selenium metabolism protein SsnA
VNFPQILERLWWRLDKLLQPDDVLYSALVFLCDAIRHGATTVIDHHASPNAIEGSLGSIAYACQQAGVRGCLCYEATDRDGPERFRRGLAENERFAHRVLDKADHERGMLAASVGLHASFTLSDESLRLAGSLARDLGIGCHIHVAEDLSDEDDSLRRSGVRVVDRLAAAGILGPRTIAAHCVHVNDAELDLLKSSGTRVVHNPRSNMNNAVGAAAVPAMLARGIPVALGNDGFSMNMFQEMKAAYFIHKHVAGDPRAMPGDQVAAMQWENGASAAGALLGIGNLGRLTVGAPADLVILDYQAPTPVTAGNLPWHLLFGADGENVRTTIIAGRVLMRDRQLLTLDEEHIYAQARRLSAALWTRIS